MLPTEPFFTRTRNLSQKTAANSNSYPKLRFHDPMHTFGTMAVQAFSLSDVKAYLGHADIATTVTYVHHVPQIDAAES